jgi:hypothetical protein
MESILPISHLKVELASFDIHKISNPNVVNYQEGSQLGFYNVKAYVLSRDEYKCQKCKVKNVKLHIHHIVFKSRGGTNTPSNLITLCEACHKKLHEGDFELSCKRSKTKHATEVGIVKSQMMQRFGGFEVAYGYETKFKRENVLNLPKTHYFDAVSICCENTETVTPNAIVYYKKHVSKGDYQQTKGKRSEIKIPTGKLFGLRKFDYIQTPKGTGFVKGKRSTGYFAVSDLSGNRISSSVNVKTNCSRISARTTTLIEKRTSFSSPT